MSYSALLNPLPEGFHENAVGASWGFYSTKKTAVIAQAFNRSCQILNDLRVSGRAKANAISV